MQRREQSVRAETPPPAGQKDEDHGQAQSLRLLGKHWCPVETWHCDDLGLKQSFNAMASQRKLAGSFQFLGNPASVCKKAENRSTE